MQTHAEILPMTTFYYYDRFGKKRTAAIADKANFNTMKILLLEDSQTNDLGSIYYTDKEGKEVILCYYNS